MIDLPLDTRRGVLDTSFTLPGFVCIPDLGWAGLGWGWGWAGDGGLFANNGAQLSVMLHFSFVFCHQHRLAFCLPCSGLAVPSDICHIYPISTLH